jgi:hypothetical protein
LARSWSRIVVEEDPGVIEVYDNGRMMQGLNVAMCDADVEATRTGYKCISCWENLDNAFPKSCPVCSFPCAERQAEQFARVYKGHDPSLRTSADWEKEADALQERQERRAFEKRAAKSGISLGLKGISIPKGLR